MHWHVYASGSWRLVRSPTLRAVRTSLATLAVGASSLMWAGESGSLSIAVPYTVRRISINGDLSEWDSAATIEFRAPSERGARDNSATVRVLWDSDKLYVAFVVRDTELMGRHVGDDQRIWLDDAVEVFLDTKRNGQEGLLLPDEEFKRRGGRYDSRGAREFKDSDDYHVVVNVRGSLATARGVDLSPDDYSWDSDVLHAVASNGTINNGADIDSNYVVELAIPWASMGVKPRGGLVLGADFAVEDVDPDRRLPFGWSDIVSFNKPYLWGVLVLNGGTHATGHPLSMWIVGAICVVVALAVWVSLRWAKRTREGNAVPAAADRTADIVGRVLEYIENNYTTPGLSASKAARALGISQRYLALSLSRQHQPLFGTILRCRRIAGAKELLSATTLSMAEIASAAGFGTQKAFSTQFRTEVGGSPSEFRKNLSRA
jgi:AraC-like DNA-binding protein